jgi:hypothetical protein
MQAAACAHAGSPGSQPCTHAAAACLHGRAAAVLTYWVGLTVSRPRRPAAAAAAATDDGGVQHTNVGHQPAAQSTPRVPQILECLRTHIYHHGCPSYTFRTHQKRRRKTRAGSTALTVCLRFPQSLNKIVPHLRAASTRRIL